MVRSNLVFVSILFSHKTKLKFYNLGKERGGEMLVGMEETKGGGSNKSALYTDM